MTEGSSVHLSLLWGQRTSSNVYLIQSVLFFFPLGDGKKGNLQWDIMVCTYTSDWIILKVKNSTVISQHRRSLGQIPFWAKGFSKWSFHVLPVWWALSSFLQKRRAFGGEVKRTPFFVQTGVMYMTCLLDTCNPNISETTRRTESRRKPTRQMQRSSERQSST